jgi:transcription elongation GreA/GreB family factor
MGHGSLFDAVIQAEPIWIVALYQTSTPVLRRSGIARWYEDFEVSVAFTKEDSAETAAETMLPEKSVPPGPNLVTAKGLAALQRQLAEASSAYQAALSIENVNERRRQAANPYRELRYLTERIRTAQIVSPPETTDTVSFGSRVTIERADGRTQTFTIVGEDEADPKAGSISFASPLARALMGRAVGDTATLGDAEVDVIAIV